MQIILQLLKSINIHMLWFLLDMRNHEKIQQNQKNSFQTRARIAEGYEIFLCFTQKYFPMVQQMTLPVLRCIMHITLNLSKAPILCKNMIKRSKHFDLNAISRIILMSGVNKTPYNISCASAIRTQY